MKHFETISINHQSNGVSVRVGCMVLVYQQGQIKQFITDLENYLKEPLATEKEIRKRWGVESLTTQECQPCEPSGDRGDDGADSPTR